jgi:hypothetical protein
MAAATPCKRQAVPSFPGVSAGACRGFKGPSPPDGIGIMLKSILPDVLPQPNHTRHEWARWNAYIYTRDPDSLFAEFTQRGRGASEPLA